MHKRHLKISRDNCGDPAKADECGPPAPWFSNIALDIFVLVACFIALGLAILLLWYLVKIPYIWWRERRAKSREPVADGHELLEREEPVEEPRRSEGSTRSCYDVGRPVENNAEVEV